MIIPRTLLVPPGRNTARVQAEKECTDSIGPSAAPILRTSTTGGQFHIIPTSTSSSHSHSVSRLVLSLLSTHQCVIHASPLSGVSPWILAQIHHQFPI